MPPVDDPTCQALLAPWAAKAITKSFFKTHGFTRHHVTHFNRYLKQDAPQVVDETAPKAVIHPDGITKTVFTIGNLFIRTPRIYEEDGSLRCVGPNEVQLRASTYQNDYFVDVTATTFVRSHPLDTDWLPASRVIGRRVRLGPVPAMTGSHTCTHAHVPDCHLSAKYEFPGTFIVNGVRRVVIPEDVRVHNYIITMYHANKRALQCEVRSRGERRHRSTSTLVIHMPLSRGVRMARIYVNVPYIESPKGMSDKRKLLDIPITAVARLLGFTSREHFTRAVVSNGADLTGKSGWAPQDEAIAAEVEDMSLWVRTMLAEDRSAVKHLPDFFAGSTNDAVRWIVRNSEAGKDAAASEEAMQAAVKQVWSLFMTEVHPQQGTKATPAIEREKKRLIVHMVWRMCRVARLPEDELKSAVDSPDNVGFKQFVTAGARYAVRLRQLLTDVVNGMATTFVEEGYRLPDDFHRLVRSRRTKQPPLLEPFRFAMTSGVFSLDRSSKGALGCSQALTDQSLEGGLGHMNRININMPAQSWSFKTRLVTEDGSQRNAIGPAATSEGANVGHIKECAMMSDLCVGIDVATMMTMPFAVCDAFSSENAVLLRGPSGDALVDPIEEVSEDEEDVSMEDEEDVEDADDGEEETKTKTPPPPPVYSAASIDEDAAIAALDGPSAGWVICNGVLMAFVRDLWVTQEQMMTLRRGQVIPKHTSLWVDQANRTLIVEGMPGTMRWPLIRFIDGDAPATFRKIEALVETHKGAGSELWRELERESIVEWVGPNETRNLHVRDAPDLRHGTPSDSVAWQPFTHCCVTRTEHQSYTVAQSPLTNHNQSPRNTYQGAMGRASMGRTTLYDMPRQSELVLDSAQLPITRTQIAELSGSAEMPKGMNVIVAILALDGVCEDALILKKSALERGLGHGHIRTCITEHIAHSAGRSDRTRLGRPTTSTVNMSVRDYSKVTPDGLPRPGTQVINGDVVLGVTMDLSSGKGKVEKSDRCQAARLNRGETATVESVLVCSDAQRQTVHVSLSRPIRPEIGSKASSQHGQKGVFSLVIPEEDMPFTRDGVTPDIIINTHGIHSRMTIGHMLETLMNKVGAMRGQTMDGTPFADIRVLAETMGVTQDEINSQINSHGSLPVGTTPLDLLKGVTMGAACDVVGKFAVVDTIGAALTKLGMSSTGNEVLYSGTTGEKLNGTVFMGPTFYQFLKQIVTSKFRARSRGSRIALTQQPNEGRSNDGALRFGEMERGCLLGYGTAAIAQDRMRDCVDRKPLVMCTKCGLLAEPACDKRSSGDAFVHRAAQPYCRTCSSSMCTENLVTRHATRLTMQETYGAGIAMRLMLDTNNKDIVANAAPGWLQGSGYVQADDEAARLREELTHMTPVPEGVQENKKRDDDDDDADDDEEVMQHVSFIQGPAPLAVASPITGSHVKTKRIRPPSPTGLPISATSTTKSPSSRGAVASLSVVLANLGGLGREAPSLKRTRHVVRHVEHGRAAVPIRDIPQK